jgi:probable HAF family extracellular repeat protein
LYSGGAFTDLGTDSGNFSDATAINNGGQIAGNGQHAFIYSGGAFHDLAAPPGMSDPTIYGINSSGQLVGWTEQLSSANSFQAVLYSGGAFHQIGTLGGSISWAYAINNSGQIVGWAQTSAGDSHAFLYANGGMMDLGTIGGGDSQAHAINDAGEVVGDSEPANDVNGNIHAFLYSDGSMTDLGLLPGKPSSLAAGINGSGQVVGESFGGPGLDSRAFLYQDGTMYDLNNLLVNQPDYVVADALGINASGQIVGIADMPNGRLNAILLTPTSVPLPPAAWVGLTALPLVLITKRFRPTFARSAVPCRRSCSR